MDGSSVQTAILFTSGVACLAVLFDVAARYIFKKEETRDEKDFRYRATEQRTVVTKTEEHILNDDVIEEEVTSMTLTSQDMAKPEASYTLRSSPSKATPSKPQSRPTTRGWDGDSGYAVSPTHSLETDDVIPTGRFFGLGDLVNDLVDAMRTTVNLGQNEEDLPTVVSDSLTSISGLEEHCSNMSAEIDACAVRLTQNAAIQEDTDSTRTGDNGSGRSFMSWQKRVYALRHGWNALRRLLFCADFHERNATAYQTYFYEVEELKRQLDAFYAYFSEKEASGNSDGTDPGEIQKALKDIQKYGDCFLFWESAVLDLLERSRRIVPVHMRTEKVDDPISVRSICEVTTKELHVREGESLILLNNDDHRNWKVRNAEGTESHLPALCVLIPPPDKQAMRTAYRLNKTLEQNYKKCMAAYQSRLLKYCQMALKGILDKQLRDQILKVIHGGNKEKMTELLFILNSGFNKEFTGQNGFDGLMEKYSSVLEFVSAASIAGKEARNLHGDVTDVLEDMTQHLGFLQKLSQKHMQHKNNMMNYGSSMSEDSEWDTLEDLDQAPRDESGLAISVHEQSTTYGQSSSFVSSTGEVRQSFSIRGVLDPRDNSEISMQEAIARRIINQLRGVYCDAQTGIEMPIAEAMSKGLILVESSETKQMRESTQAVGLVAMTITRESRPYTIKKVRDPRNDEMLTVTEAVEEGVFNAEKGQWMNPDTGETLSAKDAISSGVLIVEYDETADETKPEVSSVNMAVFGVLDRKSGKRIPFYEACQKGFIDKDEGIYTDSMTGEKLHMIDAAQKGWVNIRVVDDPSKIEQYMHLYTTRSRSGTTDSSHSE